MEMERIGARPKIHDAVSDPTHEERITLAPHVEQTADVEPTCLDVPPFARRIRLLANRQAGLWLCQRELEILAASTRHKPCSGWRADPQACRADEIRRPNCESQAAGIRGCDCVGMQSHAMAKVEIEALQSQERPDADAYRIDAGDHALAQGCGLDSLADRALERGFQQHRGQACDQRCGDPSCEPPASAGSKRDHRLESVAWKLVEREGIEPSTPAL